MRRDPKASSWAEVFVITRALFGILFWPIAALLGILTITAILFLLFILHWAFGILLLAFILALITGFAIWERRQLPPL